jgi:hypothetical protein
MGAVYFGIGAVLILMHDRHMARRTRAGPRMSHLFSLAHRPQPIANLRKPPKYRAHAKRRHTIQGVAPRVGF